MTIRKVKTIPVVVSLASLVAIVGCIFPFGNVPSGDQTIAAIGTLSPTSTVTPFPPMWYNCDDGTGSWTPCPEDYTQTAQAASQQPFATLQVATPVVATPIIGETGDIRKSDKETKLRDFGDVLLVNSSWKSCDSFNPEVICWNTSLTSLHQFSVSPGGPEMTYWTEDLGNGASQSRTFYFKDGFCGGSQVIQFVHPDARSGKKWQFQIIKCQ